MHDRLTREEDPRSNVFAKDHFRDAQNQGIESRRAAGVRFAISLAALLSMPGKFEGTSGLFRWWAPYIMIGGYVAWNLAALSGTVVKYRSRLCVQEWEHFFDVTIYTLLLLSASPPPLVFYLGLLLSVLMLSSRLGTVIGLRICIISACLLSVFHAYRNHYGWSNFSSDYPMMDLTILTAGIGLAHWGGRELRERQRLTLLIDVSRFSNPRFGVHETIGQMAQRLRSVFNADICVIVYTASDGLQHLLHRSDRRSPEQWAHAVTLVESVARRLLNFPNEQSFIHTAEGGLSGTAWFASALRKLAGAPQSHASAEELEEVAEMFDAEALMSVPLNFCFAKSGRVYLINRRGRTFRQYDLGLLQDAVLAAKPTIENVRLVNHLATEAAEQERKRIARDLHDTTIQPYIGLMLGLSAVHRKIEIDPMGAVEDVLRLLRNAEAELDDVRGYVRCLKDKDGEDYEFLVAVRRFVKKFEETTGIVVELEVEDQVRLNDRLAAEAYQLIAEGFSNIRRHATATRATLGIWQRGGRLLLILRNNVPDGCVPAAFSPKSLAERTAALGGELSIRQDGGGSTCINISIPL